MGRKIMIVGASFADKGAQARLFTVIDELRKRYADAEIYFAHNDEQFDGGLYRFGKISLTPKAQSQLLKANPLSGLTKMFRKKDDSPVNDNDITELVSQMNLMIDVSEHVLTDQTPMPEIEYYLNNIKIAKKYKIPMIIMPQSFGPFDFSMADMHILGDMKDILFYPKAIYAREQYGYDELMGYFGLDNLRRAWDILMRDSDFELTNVCSRFYRPDVPEIPEGNNVAIIPNVLCFDKKYYDNSIDLYKMIFETLKSAGRTAYIICQNSSDMEICKELDSYFGRFERINLINRELDSVEFDIFLSNFEFVISSRYSACAQAYRKYIPVLALGPGAKYPELLELFGQEEFYFDITSEECNNYDVIDALKKYLKEPDIAKTRLQTRMLNIETDSCFAIFDELKW